MDISFCLNDFIELDNVGMPEYFENAYFTSDAFNVRLLYNFFFLEGFDGYFFLCEYVGSKFHFSECSLTDAGTYPIVAKNDLILGGSGHKI
jgi:hypothetical protein